ncbi:MAG: hypothetical protein N2559_08855, partial [Anaerolineae bacterium]|nr:hypothetical protein [Anaerolineae bacterium]
MSSPQARAFTFRSRESIIEFLRAWNYRVQPTPFDLPPDFPPRARELIGNLELLASYDGEFPFQIFLVELNVPRAVKRVRKTDLRTILDPFYRRYPQGDYLFICALTDYASVAFVSPKRIRDYRMPTAEGREALSAVSGLPSVVGIKTQLRILTIDPGHLYHTDEWVLEQIRLASDEQDAKTIWDKHLTAFDVERVTKRFYENYVTVLDSLKAELARQGVEDADARKIHAFAEQLLNRVMFLYFVQRKNWLRWADGTPDSRFLRNLWHKYRESKHDDNFYARWLVPLFFGAFNRDRARVLAARLPRDIEDAFLNRMPYLNGGLFEPNELDGLNFTVPDTLFTFLFDRFNNEEPGFLERYNFTVDESTALEVEVAVDPEMLGKVYESQVQQEERHGAGIFYTPRAEIDYMCRLSLVEYLHTRTRIGKDKLIPFVFDPLPNLSLCEERELRAIESALQKVRVCDGAVGSGSFLVGMMKVLAELQQGIAERLERKRFNEFDLKRRIIMENLYGVDVKDWAVRVCELRLWLALTIEAREEQIGLYTQPILPKLSFRIRTGDSLVEEVAETPLVLRGAGRIPSALEKRLQQLAQDKAEFFLGKSHKKPQIIEQEEQKLLTNLLNEQIARLDAQIRELQDEQLGLAGIADERARKQSDDPHRARVKALTARRDALIKVRAQIATGKTPPFFVWDVGFGEVFVENRGFDIFIGNPPYVRQEEIASPTQNADDYDADAVSYTHLR